MSIYELYTNILIYIYIYLYRYIYIYVQKKNVFNDTSTPLCNAFDPGESVDHGSAHTAT